MISVTAIILGLLSFGLLFLGGPATRTKVETPYLARGRRATSLAALAVSAAILVAIPLYATNRRGLYFLEMRNTEALAGFIMTSCGGLAALLGQAWPERKRSMQNGQLAWIRQLEKLRYLIALVSLVTVLVSVLVLLDAGRPSADRTVVALFELHRLIHGNTSLPMVQNTYDRVMDKGVIITLKDEVLPVLLVDYDVGASVNTFRCFN